MISKSELVPLGRVADFVNGFAFKPAHWVGKGKKIIRIQNLTDPTKPYNLTDHEVPHKYLIKQHDILVSWSATLGVYIWKSVEEAIVNQHIFKVIPDEEIVNRSFLVYAIENAIESMRRYTHGSTMKHINRKEFLSTKIYLPLLPEQKRIAAILDKADALRQKRRRALARLDDLLQSVFLDMFGDPVTNPMGWEATTLEQIATIGSGATKGRKFNGKQTVQIPYMRVANVQDGKLELDVVKTIEVLPSDIERYKLESGDILLTEGGDPDKLGRGAIWRGEIDLCIHQNHIFKVRTISELISPEYLIKLIASPRGKRYFFKAAKQTTGIATINKTQLKAFPVLLPSLKLQRIYIRYLSELDTVKGRYQESLIKKDYLFHSLQQRAFRGELSAGEGEQVLEEMAR